jgi:hypothetical protein
MHPILRNLHRLDAEDCCFIQGFRDDLDRTLIAVVLPVRDDARLDHGTRIPNSPFVRLSQFMPYRFPEPPQEDDGYSRFERIKFDLMQQADPTPKSFHQELLTFPTSR